jgi:hypothetical protein
MSPTRGSASPGVVAAAPARSAPECPKCGAPRAAEACARCGLVYERWRGFRRAVFTDCLETERLWRAAARDFFVPRRHAVFIAHCLHAGELHYAVARYAGEARSPDVERARVARERRRQAAALAEAIALPPTLRAEHPGGLTRRLVRLVGGVAVVLLFAFCALSVSGVMLLRAARANGLGQITVPPPATVRVASPSSAAAPAGVHLDAPPPRCAPAGRGI